MLYANEHAGFGYVAVKAMANAWAKAGTTDTDAVIDALQSDIEVPEAPRGVRGSSMATSITAPCIHTCSR